MSFEIIEEYPAEPDQPATILAWISEPDQRDIGIQVLIRDDLNLDLIEYSDRNHKEYERVFIGRDELDSLLELRDYARKKWGIVEGKR